MTPKYTLLSETYGDGAVDVSTTSPRPFTFYIGIVGLSLFFLLYIGSATNVFRYSLDQNDSTTASELRAYSSGAIVLPSPTGGAGSMSGHSGATHGGLTPPNAKAEPLLTELDSLRLATKAYNVSDPGLYKNYVIYTRRCRIRSYDFNEPRIIKKYFTTYAQECSKDSKDTRPFVFHATPNQTAGRSCVGFDKAAFKKYLKPNANTTIDHWNCTYRPVLRDTSNEVVDRHHKFGKRMPLKVGSCPNAEFLWINCVLPGGYNASTAPKYEQPLALPLVKPVRYPLMPNNFGKPPLHVLVVGLDSMSRLNAHRQFPKTLKYLKKKKNLMELFGYNKVGLNSAPNQIALLTGIQWNPDPGLNSRVQDMYFDNATRLLWDEFAVRGYRTMFYEEQWKYGLFVYSSLKGFKKTPTTYWPRPLMQAIDKSALKNRDFKMCLGPDFPAKHYLDYTHQTMKLLGSDRPIFSYSWLSETAHDEVNGGHRVDGYFEDFFKKMERDGILNSTAVFFISDHGFRFGSFRATELGRYEDMLPYGFVLMPDWYYRENPQALANMKENQRRLVTVYDLHTTIRELADVWQESRTTQTAYGYSLLSHVVPDDRDCATAHIGFQYCMCFEPQPVSRDGPLAKSLASFVLARANAIIAEENATSLCREWTLRGIDDFRRLSEGAAWTDYFKISLSLQPKGQFEAAARFVRQPTVKNNSTARWELIDDIDRTDWFSSHSKCVKEQSFERMCYCRPGASK